MTSAAAGLAPRRAPAGRRPAAAGRGGRAADPAEHRPDPAAVHRRGARPRLRPLRYDGRASRRRPGRSIGGLILAAFGTDDGWRYVFFVNVPIGVRRDGARAAAAAEGRAARGQRSARRSTGSGRCCSASPCSRCCCRSSRRWASPRPRCGSWCCSRRSRRGRSCAGSAGSCGAGARRCSTCGCSGRHPGYASGIVLGTTYFCGFSGIWLVLALYLQDGLGLHAPAVRAGRDAVRDRLGRGLDHWPGG